MQLSIEAIRDRVVDLPEVELTGGGDHLVLRRGEARVALVEAPFFARAREEQAHLTGDAGAPLILIGEPPPGADATALAALGVEGHWPTLAEVPVRQLELLLARRDHAVLRPVRDELHTVLAVAASLNAERDPDRLLGQILRRMRELTWADAGSLYVVEEQDGVNVLRFRAAQNDTLGLDAAFAETLPLDETSIAGRVVVTCQPLNVSDAYHLPPGPFQFNASFDARSGYRTVSMLTVPLQTAAGEVVGAVQLINRKRRPDARLGPVSAIPQQVVPFTARDQALATSLAGAASIALINSRLSAEIERLFDGFVRAAVYAVDARDPTTSGHSLRVSRLAVGLADAAIAAERLPVGRLVERAGRRRLEYAALLHDFGKVGVAEQVLLKAKRLYPAELETLQTRFEVIALSHEVQQLRAALEAGRAVGDVEPEIVAFKADLHAMLARLLLANEPRPLDGETRGFIDALAGRCWHGHDGRTLPYLTERERTCLSIPYGSLTDPEREAIQNHVVHTRRFLEQIPWDSSLKGIANIAALHHEKLDGSGYPYGYSGDQIPLESRIITVVDIYDALTAADRPYKAALPHVAASDILWNEAERGRLDRRLVDIFVERNVHSCLA